MSETTKETLSFQTEVKQLLDLMIHSLYSNKEIFLRELISNASDAADKLRFEATTDDALFEGNSDLHVFIGVDKEARTITVRDNGIGMNRDEVIDNIGTIARSGSKEFFGQLTGDQEKDAHLIGQFGVGFYSSFLVADRVTLTTRRAGLTAEHGVRWESTGDGEYSLETIEKAERGTEITLHLREDADEFLESFRLHSIIHKYADHIPFPIRMFGEAAATEEGEVSQPEIETVNQASALWTRPKSELSEEEYNNFYKHVSHMEANEELLPRYLRFVRGVMDTNDLPLNVSREILQKSPAMDAMKKGATKRILSLLEDMAKNNPDDYASFWGEFGNALKEGVIEDFTNKEKIAALLRFSSTESDEQNIPLADYVSRMKEGQEKIYYITAESLSAAKGSPHLELFRKKGVEVLLLSDRIDEWLTSNLNEFDGKSLQSVAKGEVDLSAITSDGKTAEEDAKEQEEKAKSAEPAVGKIREALGDRVKDVRVTNRLTESPACLVADQFDMSGNMDRILKQLGQNAPGMKPILEINPDHAIVKRLAKARKKELISDLSSVLFDQALLAEGALPDDPAGFVRRINALLIK
jgi:molecular chaperone HtpG